MNKILLGILEHGYFLTELDTELEVSGSLQEGGPPLCRPTMEKRLCAYK